MHIQNLWRNVNLIPPNVPWYERKKGIQVINQEDPVRPDTLGMAPGMPEAFLEDEQRTCWKQYHGPLIDLAAGGRATKVMRQFPGRKLPGPCRSTIELGATAWEVFLHTLSMPQRRIDPKYVEIGDGGYCYTGPKPPIKTVELPLPDNWPWAIEPPQIRQLQLLDFQTKATIDDVLHFLRSEVKHLLEKYTRAVNKAERFQCVRQMLSLVHIVQNPFAPLEILADVVEAAEWILCQYTLAEEKVDTISLLFQIETELMYLTTTRERNLVAFGEFRGVWVEITEVPLRVLKNTELVTVERTIAEVETLSTISAWAPIVTDEHLNNTDGSHRAIAVQVWNLLHYLDLGLDDVDLGSEEVTLKLQRFLEDNILQALTLRETLRIAQELLTNRKFNRQKQVILEKVARSNPISSVYTVLLPEKQACCVIKQPFDEKGETIGLPSPFIYQELMKLGNGALGARGPYHRTDRTLLPWVKYLFI